jgi:hypothetical protein
MISLPKMGRPSVILARVRVASVESYNVPPGR